MTSTRAEIPTQDRDKYIFQSIQIHLAILTNTLKIPDKYKWQFFGLYALQLDGNWKSLVNILQIDSTNWKNAFANLDKYILQFGLYALQLDGNWKSLVNICQIYDTNWTKEFFQFGQIYFVIQTNTFWNFDKYILKFRQIHFEI